METFVLPPNPAAVLRAVELLDRGEVVALPTETVYGLAGDAANPAAAAAIFHAKERPLFDPLIVHLPDAAWLPRLTHFASERQQHLVEVLQTRFWPGPLTLLLPRRGGAVPDLVTAGSPLVAVRISAHPVFRQVIERFGRPLAAPSANRFGRISPTSGEDARQELAGRIPLIIEAGRTAHGLESTIVQPHEDGSLTILRHGPVTEEALREFGPVGPPLSGKVVTPGRLPGHYAPRTPLRLVAGSMAEVRKANGGQKLGLLSLRGVAAHPGEWHAAECLSLTGDLKEAAVNFFAALRRLDGSGSDLILAEPVPAMGLGAAIMERLERAAAGSGGV